MSILTSLVLAAVVAAPPVTLWHGYRASEAQALGQVVNAFQAEHPDIEVHTLAVPYDAFASKLTAAIPRGNGPDLFIFAHGRIGDWVKGELIEPWDSAGPEAFLGQTQEALTYDGTLYGLPVAFKSLALYYNKKLIPTPPQTTEALISLATQHTDASAGRYGLGYPLDDFYFHAPWLFGFGGDVFDAKGAIRLDGPGMVASLNYLQDISLRRGIVPTEATSALVNRLFNEGKLAMMISGPWALGELGKNLDYGITTLPRVTETNKAATPFLTVEGVMLAKRAKRPDAARVFAHYLVSEPAAVIRARVGRQSVATASAYTHPEVAQDEALSAFRTQLEHSKLMSNRPEMKLVWEPAKGALKAVMRGVDPETAVERAQARLIALTKPVPPPADPLPTIIVFGILGLLGLVVMVRSPKPQEQMLANWQRSRLAYAYLGPAFIGLVFLVLMPFAVGVGIGFTHFEGGQYVHFVGLANFKDILLGQSYGFKDPLSFYFTLGVTLLWTVSNVVLHVTLGVVFALILKEKWLRMRGVFRVLLIVPWAVPNYITALVWKGMFHKQFGAINGLLEWLGMESVPWFSGFWTAFTANLVTNTWLGFPFMMVVTLGALQSIPAHLYEAAEIDGVSAWQKFRYITLPLLRPALLPAVTVGMIWTFNMFNIIYLVSGGEPDGGTDILISEAYRWAFQRREQYGYAAAYATLIFFILVAYTFATRKIAGDKELS